MSNGPFLTGEDFERMRELSEVADRRRSPTDSTPISPANAGKPDPSEPWRYICPACDGQVSGAKRGVRAYQCSSCRKTWDRDDLKDCKNE